MGQHRSILLPEPICHSFARLFIYLFIQQTQSKHKLCARRCVSIWREVASGRQGRTKNHLLSAQGQVSWAWAPTANSDCSSVPENLHLCSWRIPVTPKLRKIRPRFREGLSWERHLCVTSEPVAWWWRTCPCPLRSGPGPGAGAGCFCSLVYPVLGLASQCHLTL